jgi:tetratricopeptide (TPR) repeat protein
MRRSMFAAAAAALLMQLPAGAAVMVLGEGPAHACYQAAREERSTRAALETCDSAVMDSSLTPRDRAATLSNRSVIRLARNEPARALADCDLALKGGENFAATYINRGAALIMLERFAEARSALDNALDVAQGTERLPALVNRAMAREALGDVKGAFADLKEALAMNPEYEPAKTEFSRYSLRNS